MFAGRQLSFYLDSDRLVARHGLDEVAYVT